LEAWKTTPGTLEWLFHQTKSLCNLHFETNTIIAYSSGTLCMRLPLIFFINEP
jgi:hypothetical protein